MSKMAAPSEFRQQSAFSVDKRSGLDSRGDASLLSMEEEVVVISDDEEEVRVSQVCSLAKEKRGNLVLSGRKGGNCMQLIPRVVSPMLHRVQSWGISNQADLQLGEQIELVDQDGNVFKGTVCGERCSSGAIDRTYVSLDLSQHEVGVGPSGCDTSHVSGDHGLQAIHQQSGRIVGEQSLPVKVRAPSLHRLEGSVKPGAVYPTSGETFGDDESQLSTSRGAGAGSASMEEVLLDYDEEFEETVSSRQRVFLSGEVPGEVQGGPSKVHLQDITVGGPPRVRRLDGCDVMSRRQDDAVHFVMQQIEAGLAAVTISELSQSSRFVFVHEDGSHLSAPQFLAVLRMSVQRLGLDPSSYGTHSFRIGAATEARRQEILELQNVLSCVLPHTLPSVRHHLDSGLSDDPGFINCSYAHGFAPALVSVHHHLDLRLVADDEFVKCPYTHVRAPAQIPKVPCTRTSALTENDAEDDYEILESSEN
ncbi:hypothetical protein NDU88_004521 [Pleurodeles waltl]|uniref:Uncharacterized protein n=1 Tax=Pleurodeles waltl TaxID=8319 RepID=A0AAV7W6W1_PLEWA|nr:hypothetical protein NDU88_004521 [Pleurodeles waltl]